MEMIVGKYFLVPITYKFDHGDRYSTVRLKGRWFSDYIKTHHIIIEGGKHHVLVRIDSVYKDIFGYYYYYTLSSDAMAHVLYKGGSPPYLRQKQLINFPKADELWHELAYEF